MIPGSEVSTNGTWNPRNLAPRIQQLPQAGSLARDSSQCRMFSCCVPTHRGSCFRRPRSETFSGLCRRWFNPRPRRLWPFSRRSAKVTQVAWVRPIQARPPLGAIPVQPTHPPLHVGVELHGGRTPRGSGWWITQRSCHDHTQDRAGRWRGPSEGDTYLCQWEL